MPKDMIAMMIIGGIVGAFAWAKAWKHFHPAPLPLFCEACGCPMTKDWIIENRLHDPTTGLGVLTQQARWRCSNAGWSSFTKSWPYQFHTVILLTERETTQIASACSTEGEPNGETQG